MEVAKTHKEKKYCNFFKAWLKSDQIIPQSTIALFTKCQNEIRLENPLYNKKLN
jgi:hypothetical protein